MNGVVVDTNDVAQQEHEMVSDGDSNAVLVFTKVVNILGGNSRDIIAQKLSPDGTREWYKITGQERVWGINITAKTGTEDQPSIAADKAGGVAITWREIATGQEGDIYAQRLDENGEFRFSETGAIKVCSASGKQEHCEVTYDDDWSFIFTWEDERHSSTEPDIYAQRIEAPAPAGSLSYVYLDSATVDSRYGPFMNGCPAGDFDGLKITIKFDTTDVLRDIAASEIAIEDDEDSLVIFWGNVQADYDATRDNTYITTMTCTLLSHDSLDYVNLDSCLTLDIPVKFTRFNDSIFDYITDFMVKSPDRNGDGYVGASDLVYLGASYGNSWKSDSFDCWMNFNGDTIVNSSDLTYFSIHYTDEYDPPEQFRFPWENEKSNLFVNFEGESNIIDGALKHIVTIYLENIAGNKLLFMSMDFNRDKLSFDEWRPNASFPKRSAVVPISKQGDEWLAAAAFKLDHYASNIIEMGTLALAVKDDSAPIDEDDIWINFADVLETNGKVKKILGAQYYPDEETPTLSTHLSGNYPNPFNPSTIIEYSIAKDDHVNLSIYNVNGQLIRTLVDEFQKRNEYKAIWDGKNNRGKTVASGVYFLLMKTGAYMMTKKLVILR